MCFFLCSHCFSLFKALLREKEAMGTLANELHSQLSHFRGEVASIDLFFFFPSHFLFFSVVDLAAATLNHTKVAVQDQVRCCALFVIFSSFSSLLSGLFLVSRAARRCFEIRPRPPAVCVGRTSSDPT